MKTCNKCGEEKLLEEFYNHKAAKDGKLNTCRMCHTKATYTRRQNKRQAACQSAAATRDYYLAPCVHFIPCAKNSEQPLTDSAWKVAFTDKATLMTFNNIGDGQC